MRRVFKDEEFAKRARKARIGDDGLRKAVADAEAGLVAAHLGGELVKIRVARAGAGKSGGFRTILAFRRDDRAFFIHLYAKNVSENIDPAELADLKGLRQAPVRLDRCSDRNRGSRRKVRGNSMRKYRSDISESVHKGVSNLHALGFVDTATLRRFDASCLTTIEEFGPEEIKALREREGASQAVMATHLGIATATLSQWERGKRKPDGTARKLLTLAKAHGLEYIR